MKTLFGLALWVAATSAWANPPTGVQYVLTGKDARTQRACHLYILEMGFTGPEQRADQFYAKVVSSYGHGHEQPEPIVVRADAQRPNWLMGVGENGKDEIGIQLPANELDPRQAQLFNLKWWHRNHFDTFRCVSLQAGG